MGRKEMLTRLKEMFEGQPVRITNSVKSFGTVRGICKKVNAVGRWKFNLEFKNGSSYGFDVSLIMPGYIHSQIDHQTSNIRVIEIIKDETKKGDKAMTSIQSIKTADGILNVGDEVFIGCDANKKTSKIVNIKLPNGAITVLKDCPGTFTSNGAECTLEDDRKAHPSCLRKIV
jgi:hypothetical protein